LSIRADSTIALSIACEDNTRMGLHVNDPPSAPYSRARLQRAFETHRFEATAFLHEIVATAARLREARAFGGELALRLDPRYALLRGIERCGGAPTFAHLARRMHVSRQAVRVMAMAAAQAGAVELIADRDDRRNVLVVLTPTGRRTLEAGRLPDTGWLFTLLNGLEPGAMRSTQHVLVVLRRRLERYAADMGRARRAAKRRAESPV
jgi:DNA-binding MarR family transcriptional regulator